MYHPDKQFACGKYQLDLYYPAQTVAVECNKGGHVQCTFQEEYERQRFIEHQLTVGLSDTPTQPISVFSS